MLTVLQARLPPEAFLSVFRRLYNELGTAEYTSIGQSRRGDSQPDRSQSLAEEQEEEERQEEQLEGETGGALLTDDIDETTDNDDINSLGGEDSSSNEDMVVADQIRQLRKKKC